jgi:hypothetical protein
MKRSLIEENSEIPELYVLRHKHDADVKEQGYNYTDNLLSRSLSPVMYNNPKTSEYVDYLSKMMVSLHDTVLPVRNLFFYSYNKYFNKHGK